MTNNTDTKVKKVSKLQRIQAEFEAAGGKPPSDKAVKALVGRLAKAKEDLEAHEKALEGLREAEHEATYALMLAVGTKCGVNVNGKPYDPSCRGERVFYKARRGSNCEMVG